MLNSTSSYEPYPRTGDLRKKILAQRENQRELELYPKTLLMRGRIISERKETKRRQSVLVARNEVDKTDNTWEYSEWTYCPAYESTLNKLALGSFEAGDPSFFQQFAEAVSDIRNPTTVDLWKIILKQERKPTRDAEMKNSKDYFHILPYNGIGRKS